MAGCSWFTFVYDMVVVLGAWLAFWFSMFFHHLWTLLQTNPWIFHFWLPSGWIFSPRGCFFVSIFAYSFVSVHFHRIGNFRVGLCATLSLSTFPTCYFHFRQNWQNWWIPSAALMTESVDSLSRSDATWFLFGQFLTHFGAFRWKLPFGTCLSLGPIKILSW